MTKQGLILAAGLGKRMRPLSNNLAKSLLPVAGRPFIEWQIMTLIESEVEKIWIVCGKDNDDFKEYVVEYIVNEEFAEWEIYGIFTESLVVFEGEDGKEYRFRSLARDIYGNTEIKNNYEYQVKIDISIPETKLLNLDENYYYIGNSQFELSWYNTADDIAYNILKVAYSNFTNINGNPNSVTWLEVDSINIYGQSEYVYEFEDIGHYGFTIIGIDYAGNIESKQEFDVIMNYASKVDTISFSEVEPRWGYNNLDIFIETSDLNLDYELYIAIQSIVEGNNLLKEEIIYIKMDFSNHDLDKSINN